MALRKILDNVKDDATLRKKSRPVTEFNSRIGGILDDMKETLKDAQGLGLAGPQVGILRRMVIIVRNNGEYVELVNPVVLKQSAETEGAYEGCLSIPGERAWLERSKYVTVKAQDRNGKEFTLDLEGMEARASLHEIDHLDGVLFIDLADEVLDEDDIYEDQ